MNISVILDFAKTMTGFFKTYGIDGLIAARELLAKNEDLPTAFDGFEPFVKEMEFVLDFFIAIGKMVFPSGK